MPTNIDTTIQLLKSIKFDDLSQVFNTDFTCLTNCYHFYITDYTNGFNPININKNGKEIILSYCINNTDNNIIIICEFDERAQMSDNFDDSFGEHDNYNYIIELKPKATIKDLLNELIAKPIYGCFEGFKKITEFTYIIKWGT